MSSVEWVDPASIRFKISPHHDLAETEGGDWDVERRHPFQETAKYRAVVQRYLVGIPWIETDLFCDAYARRLKRDGHVGKSRTLAELAQDYERRFDPMFKAMKCGGFALSNANGKPHALPILLIGRGGEVFIGNQGNHRLAIAQVLGLKKFAGKVICRHTGE